MYGSKSIEQGGNVKDYEIMKEFRPRLCMDVPPMINIRKLCSEDECIAIQIVHASRLQSRH